MVAARYTVGLDDSRRSTAKHHGEAQDCQEGRNGLRIMSALL